MTLNKEDRTIKDSICHSCEFGICLKLIRKEVIIQTPGGAVNMSEGDEWKTGLESPEGNSENTSEAKQFVARDELVGGICFWPVHTYPDNKKVEPISVQIVEQCSRYQERA